MKNMEREREKEKRSEKERGKKNVALWKVMYMRENEAWAYARWRYFVAVCM